MPTCRRCGKHVNPITGLLLAQENFNDKTGRCKQCEDFNFHALHRFRNAFLYTIRDNRLSPEEWQALYRGAVGDRLDWNEALLFIQGDASTFIRGKVFAAKTKTPPLKDVQDLHALIMALNFHPATRDGFIHQLREIWERAETFETAAMEKQYRLIRKYGDPELVDRLLRGGIVKGDSAGIVEDALGPPEDTHVEYLATKVKETWKYYEIRRGQYAFKVFLENGFVTGWEG